MPYVSAGRRLVPAIFHSACCVWARVRYLIDRKNTKLDFILPCRFTCDKSHDSLTSAVCRARCAWKGLRARLQFVLLNAFRIMHTGRSRIVALAQPLLFAVMLPFVSFSTSCDQLPSGARCPMRLISAFDNRFASTTQFAKKKQCNEKDDSKFSIWILNARRDVRLGCSAPSIRARKTSQVSLSLSHSIFPSSGSVKFALV